MKWIWILFILLIPFSIVIADPASSISKSAAPRIDAYEGRFFAGPQDSDYKDYNLALKNRVIRRIQQKFGVELSSAPYSGYDLLEIESLLRVKKANEPLDPFLRMFPRSP